MMQAVTMNSADTDVDVSLEVDDGPDDLGREEQKSKFILLRAKGNSYSRIAEELRVSKGTLVNWNSELEAEISEARSIELEALQEEYYLLKEGRIRLLGEQLKTIQAEVGKRDLSEVKTEKLLELQLRYFTELKGEYVRPGQRTRIGPKLNSREIGEQLAMLLARSIGRVKSTNLRPNWNRLSFSLFSRPLNRRNWQPSWNAWKQWYSQGDNDMTRTITPTAVKRIITKGLTGWEAGKLILQDMVDNYLYQEPFLTETDIDTIRSTRMEAADVRDYNMFIALYQGFHTGHILGEWACVDAGLHITYLDGTFRDANKRRVVELYESSGPRIVTRKQYEDIIDAQKQKKLSLEYSLGYVVEERFYAIAPPEAREEIDEICPDIESAEVFASVIPEKYKTALEQAVDEIRSLCTSDKLPAACQAEDAKEAEPLLAKWKKGQLSEQDAMKLVDMLLVTGQQLYDCEELPEWKDYANSYHQYIFGDEDERFKHVYAVLEDYTGIWLDNNGYYRGPSKASKFVARDSEYLVGLIDHNDKPKKSIKMVATELRDRLNTAEQNIRMVLAVKAILDAAAEAVELSIPNKGGMLALPYIRVGAFSGMYNLRLEAFKEERLPWESGETRLDKALKMLPAIDLEKLKPGPESLKQLKADILKDTQGNNWLQRKLRLLESEEGIRLTSQQT